MYAIMITKKDQSSKYRRFVAEDGCVISGKARRIGPGDRVKLYKTGRGAGKAAEAWSAAWGGASHIAEVVEGDSHTDIVTKHAQIVEEVKA